MSDHLAEAINHLARNIGLVSPHAIQRIEEKLDTIMSKISDFAAAMATFNDRQDAAITDLQGDVKNLSDQIAALQATSGAITPEDQALLDGIQARAKTVADKLEALDAVTPPAAPAV